MYKYLIKKFLDDLEKFFLRASYFWSMLGFIFRAAVSYCSNNYGVQVLFGKA